MKKTLTEKIENIQADIQQLKEREKTLLQRFKAEERRERTSRLCRRGGYLENKIPELKTMTEEQFYTFVEKTLLSGYAEKTIKGLQSKPLEQ
jgi:hypothetical protein